MSILNLKKAIPIEERKPLLEELLKSVRKQILTTEIDIRYLEREKIKVSKDNLGQVDNAILQSKNLKEALTAKAEVIQDELNGK